MYSSNILVSSRSVDLNGLLIIGIGDELKDFILQGWTVAKGLSCTQE